MPGNQNLFSYCFMRFITTFSTLYLLVILRRQTGKWQGAIWYCLQLASLYAEH